ncbi:hypothetical protein [Pedobacter agri]|uniref:hypothetical protein n=1 Tax=Pedobacter agri TaxID=454586 RepID=UPI0029319190|nr:hypothetical protein [Pedobacter agri]
MQDIQNSSLRSAVFDKVGNFLWKAGFKPDDILQSGVVDIINLISDYYEEGKALYPEVLLVNDLKFLEPIVHKIIPISSSSLTPDDFKLAIKLCAPLAVNGWLIFVEIKNECISYGLVSAEIDETSPSMYSQTVGELKGSIGKYAAAYIKNVGQKAVEVAVVSSRLIVELSLEEPKDYSQNEVHKLCVAITEKCDEHIKIKLKTYLEKLLDETFKIGHGNLVGVINDDEENITNIKDQLKVSGGIYLEQPVNFETLLLQVDQNKDSQSSTDLRLHASLLSSMLNHDGITIISNKARIIGYHLLIDTYINDGDKINGGSRSKAHLSMSNSGFFEFCFYKSQDGNLKFWKK